MHTHALTPGLWVRQRGGTLQSTLQTTESQTTLSCSFQKERRKPLSFEPAWEQRPRPGGCAVPSFSQHPQGGPERSSCLRQRGERSLAVPGPLCLGPPMAKLRLVSGCPRPGPFPACSLVSRGRTRSRRWVSPCCGIWGAGSESPFGLSITWGERGTGGTSEEGAPVWERGKEAGGGGQVHGGAAGWG